MGTAVRGMGTLRVRGWVCWPGDFWVNVGFWVNVRWAFFCGGDCRVSIECGVGVVSFVVYGHGGLCFLLWGGIGGVGCMVGGRC